MRIWDEFEKAHDQWRQLGEPGWDRFGLTVTPDGTHLIRLDDPGGTQRWYLTSNRQT
ncbi:hypothetical protein [Amycolatopsis speibonae]|uniref:Uncharacterized protein n=1 Tax=Amycolatopsis speibonae TaxID=1450224 RepID=A0ABV7P5L2_9PSEU